MIAPPQRASRAAATTEDIPTEPPAFDPATHHRLRDSLHSAEAGLLNRTAFPQGPWQSLLCRDPAWIGRVECHPQGILTFITSPQTQRDRKGQLHAQFAITRAIPEDGGITLHQNHAPAESGAPNNTRKAPAASYYTAKAENPVDVERFHTLGLPKGNRGERLAHYHLVFEEFKRPVLIHVLRTLAGLQVRDTPVLTPGDAAMIANALWPDQRVDASYFNADGCQPLFAPHLSKQQMADESDRLQARYDALCQQHVEQARLNLSAPLAQRKFMPLNAPPAAWGSRAAASLACIEEGHTRDGRLLAQAQDLPQLRKAYEAPLGVLTTLNHRKYLQGMKPRFEREEDYATRLQPMLQAGVRNIDRVLGRTEPGSQARPRSEAT